jgi:hypothetical protein
MIVTDDLLKKPGDPNPNPKSLIQVSAPPPTITDNGCLMDAR